MLDFTLRDPPHDIELEQAIIGAALVNNSDMDRLADLSPEEFSEPMHQALFAAMRQQWTECRALNAATLRAILRDMPAVTDALSFSDYFARLVSFGDARNVDTLATMLRDYASRRRLCLAAANLDGAARDLTVGITDAANVAVGALDTVLAFARGKRQTRVPAGDAFNDAIDAMLADDGADRITTGLISLDAVTGGWQRKQFAIIAGRPSMGKTTVATSAMLRTAHKGFGVLMFSLEMPAKALSARCLADLSWSNQRPIPYSNALAGRATDYEMRILSETAARYRQLPLTIDDQRGLTMAEIAARTRAEAQRMERNGQRLSLVVVDHLGLVKPSGRYAGNKVQEVGEISDALATLAKEQDVAVVALNQLNRGTEGRENKRPTLADLRNSGDLEQDADLVCFAYREAYYLERMKCDAGSQAEIQRQTELEACRNTMELQIAKNRNGPTTTIPLFCDMGSNAVRDLA